MHALVSTDPPDLEAAARDLSPLALLRPATLPAGVARPRSTDDVADLLRWANGTRTPIVPRGLGSGVCGGSEAVPGAVVLDLAALATVEVGDGFVRAGAGVRGSALEDALAPHGLTTGHYPQSLALSSVGGWVATASAGQASDGYGSIEQLVLGLEAVLADGTVVRLRAVPRTAAGPDLRRLLIGSEGTLAVVTEVVLACAALPQRWSWRAYATPTFDDGVALARDSRGAFVVRAYDEADAVLAFGEERCVVLFGWADAEPSDFDAERLDDALGERWWSHRNDAVRLYEQIMGPERAWGPGVIVDTLETSALWPDLPRLYARTREALAQHAEVVACHLSHTYRGGASLYFTFLLRADDDETVAAAYARAWDDAAPACLDAGGTLTHHHGVGSLKARFLERELGEGGFELLRRVKRALDPNGILNPGKLLP